MARQGQALLKRHKDMTTEQFSDYWYKHHAPLVVPMFLSAGYTYYAQIHKPLSSTDASIDLSEWDGAAESTKGIEEKDVTSRERDKYYRDVVLADERRFLLSEALQHVKFVDRDTISGDKKVIIQDGKSLIDVPEEIMKVWNDYIQHGRVGVE